jgi:metallophosphoesterase superfamily enzyme
LLGDIGVPTKEHPSAAEDYRDFLLEQCKYYEKVIVLAGNHEFYHSTIDETMKTIQNICKENNKLLFLTKDSPRFAGWTCVYQLFCFVLFLF